MPLFPGILFMQEKNTHILVVTEKPGVARTIARVLGATEQKDGYFEGRALSGGQRFCAGQSGTKIGYIVSWCVGHLVEPAPPGAYSDEWKKWSMESLPMIPEEWQSEVKESTAEQFSVLKGLMHDSRVSEIVSATDAGREGELIFRMVYEKTGCRKLVKRLWISSMEEGAIREGFSCLKSGSDYDCLYEAALCRQRADWLVGLNGTRLFTMRYGGKVLKVGRVQTPTLAMLVEREEIIRNFRKEPYYIAHILMDGMEAATERIDGKARAEAVAAACEGKNAAVVSATKEKKILQPPKLYDLTTLQREANRLFGFTAKQTLEYTQSLYEKKLATYPRTDSRYLPEDMEDTVKDVVGAVCQSLFFERQYGAAPNVRRVMDGKKVTDHHAVIPTMEIAKADLATVPEGEMMVLSLMAVRLLCAVGEPQEYETVRAVFGCGGASFTVSGKSVTKNGWKDIEAAFRRSYKTIDDKETEENKLPELSEGMEFSVARAGVTEHFTSPPKHFTEDSLLLAMERAGAADTGADAERKGLGTPATRADIIEKLVHDGFVERKEKQLVPTGDGIKLIGALPDAVKSPQLTADWENALALVAKGEMPMQQFMESIECMVKELVREYGGISEEKGLFANGAYEVLGKCPKCGGDVAKGKYGAYCRNKCGMNVSRAMGAELSDSQVVSLLDGKKTLVKGLNGKKGSYDAYLIPEGVEEYSYTKDGKELKGFRYQLKLEFPQGKQPSRKK